MKILITGGSGFIGLYLAVALQKENHKVFVIDKCINKKIFEKYGSSITFFKANLNDYAKIKKIIKKIKPNLVSHHAAIHKKKDTTDKKTLWSTNVFATFNLLKEIKKNNCKKIIFASSAAVYQPSTIALTEKERFGTPTTLYGLSKLVAEKIISLYCTKNAISYLIFRYSNIYGPGQDLKNGGVLAKMIKASLNDQTFVIDGNGRQQRDFVFIKDVLKANLQIVNSKKLANTELNISTSKTTSIIDLASEVTKHVHLNFKFVTSNNQGNLYNNLSATKAKSVVNWRATTKLNKGVEKTIKAYL